MKKYAPYLILFILSILIWNALFDHSGVSFMLDDESFDGPLGGIAGFLLASGGAILGLVIGCIVAVVLAVVFAGVGVVIVAAVLLAALVTILAVSPLMLPLLIPVAILWFVASRNRNRARHDEVKPVVA